MNRELVRELTLYVASQLRDMDSPISTIRLVKFLYLIDLEYYRRNYETLTGLDWKKYKFGPYAFELPSIFKSLDLDLEPEEVLTSSGRGVTFKSQGQHPLPGGIDSFGASIVNRTIKLQAGHDTPALLENVYATLPVKHGKFGEPLDFTYETDHLVIEDARKTIKDFITFDELVNGIGEAGTN